MEDKSIQPINYFYNWNQSIKNYSNSFLNFIQFNFNSSFIRNIINIDNSKYVEVQQIYNKYQEKINNDPDFYIDKNKEQILKEITKDILNKLTSSEISIMTSYHSYLSIATGINCGLSTKNKELCVIKKMEHFFQIYFNHDKKIKNNLIQNDIKYNLLDIMIKKKSNKKIFLVNLLLKNVFKNKSISKILLKEANLIQGNLLNDEEVNYLINSNKNKEIINEPETMKENCNPNIENEKNFKVENKNSTVVNTLISINGFVTNSGLLLNEQYQRKNNVEDVYQDVSIKNKKIDKNIELKDSTFWEKNKYLLLNNEYFINLEKEYLFDYEFFDHEKLLEILISLLDINNNIGILSIKLIINNILLLITNKNKSIISQNNKNKIYLIYEKYKNEIVSNYNTKKYFHNNSYQLFIKQYDNYLILENLDFNKYITKNEKIFISKSFEEYLLSIINININDKNKYEKTIINFLLIHDFYYKLISFDDNFTFRKIKDQNDNLFINNFSLIKRDIPIKKNKQYYLINLDLNILYYDCKCKIIINKMNNDESFFDAYLFILDNFIFIGNSSDVGTYTTIIYKFFISNCSIQKDNYNNKNINLYINNNIYDNNNIKILIDFKDFNTSKYVSSIIQQEIKKSIFFEKNEIKKFIKNLN